MNDWLFYYYYKMSLFNSSNIFFVVLKSILSDNSIATLAFLTLMVVITIK